MKASEFINEAAIGTETKRPSRAGSRPDRGHNTTQYQVVCDGTKKGIFQDKEEAILNAKSMFKHEKEYTHIAVVDLSNKEEVWSWDKKQDVAEGIVDTIRGKNYNRLAKRSFNKALSAQDKASEYDFDNPERFGHEDEFAQQMRKMRQREKKADELELDEFAPGGTMKPPSTPTKKRDPWGDDERSQLLVSIKQLLDKGAKVDSYLFGARGHITGVANDYFGFYFKKLNKPHSKSGFLRPMNGADDSDYMLRMVKPGYYQLWDKSIADEQGVAEAIAQLEQELNQLSEHGKASRELCKSSKPDADLGASMLASCKSQGLRARDGDKSHKLGKTAKSRVKVGGHRIKGQKYGGPLPDYSE